MPKIDAIPGLSPDHADLLGTAGYLDTTSLVKAGAAGAHAELLRAHATLGIQQAAPDLATVRGWVAAAEALGAGEPAPSADPRELPLAVPLAGRVLRDRGISIAEVPPAILPDDSQARAPRAVRRSPERGTQPDANSRQRVPLDPNKLRSVRDFKSPEQLERERLAAERTPNNLLKTARAETNEGVDPQSRRYVRGVLHPRPLRVLLGSLVTMGFVVWVPVSVVAVVLMMVDDLGSGITWLPEWIFFLPGALPVALLLYLLVGAGVKCRVCGQRLLAPKHCRKNHKAHHIRGLGHIVPLALHVLLFRWFRCTFCGTAVRLRE